MICLRGCVQFNNRKGLGPRAFFLAQSYIRSWDYQMTMRPFEKRSTLQAAMKNLCKLSKLLDRKLE
jgi:hypothetical protein